MLWIPEIRFQATHHTQEQKSGILIPHAVLCKKQRYAVDIKRSIFDINMAYPMFLYQSLKHKNEAFKPTKHKLANLMVM